jgi:hypothetical protein
MINLREPSGVPLSLRLRRMLVILAGNHYLRKFRTGDFHSPL